MIRMNPSLSIVALLACGAAALSASAAETGPADLPWGAVRAFQYGQDLKPLLVVERAAYRSVADPAQRQAMAQQLVGILSDSKATSAARQFVAIQLRTVAGPAEVPALVKLLGDAGVADWAREVLEAIPGKESLQALREALPRLEGKMLVGAVNGLGARRDAEAVPALTALAGNSDAAVAEAAVRALGKIGGPAAVEALGALWGKASPERAAAVAASYLRATESLAASGTPEKAASIYETLSAPGNPAAIRRAAMHGLLSLKKDRLELVVQWLAGSDEDARQIAGGELEHLAAPEQVKRLVEQLPQLPAAGRALVLEALAEQLVPEVLPTVVAAAGDADAGLRLAGVQSLAMVGQSDQVPLVVERLADKDSRIATAARESLVRISAPGVDEAILAGLKTADDRRRGILVEVLAQRRAAIAVPTLVIEARQPQPERYGKAVASLRALSTPGDLPALIKLLLAVEKGSHRDEIEKTIMLVCEQIEDPQNRAEPILATMEQLKPADRVVLLPLAGRIGGRKAREAVDAAIRSPQRDTHEAGIRALCNWPDASVSEPLLKLAKEAPNPHRVWALRAYIRVISLPSDRPEAETLSMLQQAMQLATEPAEKKLVLNRASAVRTVQTLRWVAPYLDDPALAQEASRAVVELAHHRFLMYPNRKEFVPVLEKVVAVCKDQQLVSRAKEYIQRQ